jgi:hypothetical protein
MMVASTRPQAFHLPDVVHLDVRPTNCKFAIGWSLHQIEKEFLLRPLEVIYYTVNMILFIIMLGLYEQ